jgi:hypothetical protein
MHIQLHDLKLQNAVIDVKFLLVPSQEQLLELLNELNVVDVEEDQHKLQVIPMNDFQDHANVNCQLIVKKTPK